LGCLFDDIERLEKFLFSLGVEFTIPFNMDVIEEARSSNYKSCFSYVPDGYPIVVKGERE